MFLVCGRKSEEKLCPVWRKDKHYLNVLNITCSPQLKMPQKNSPIAWKKKTFSQNEFKWNIWIIGTRSGLGSLSQPHSCGMTSKHVIIQCNIKSFICISHKFSFCFSFTQNSIETSLLILYTGRGFFINTSAGLLGLNTAIFFLLHPFIHPSQLPCIHPGQNKNSLFKRLPRQCQHIGSTGAEVVQLTNPGLATPPSALHNSNLLLNLGQVRCSLVAAPSVCHRT